MQFCTCAWRLLEVRTHDPAIRYCEISWRSCQQSPVAIFYTYLFTLCPAWVSLYARKKKTLKEADCRKLLWTVSSYRNMQNIDSYSLSLLCHWLYGWNGKTKLLRAFVYDARHQLSILSCILETTYNQMQAKPKPPFEKIAWWIA